MLQDLMQKNEKLVVGLMSGTSADGVDAVLCRITGHGLETKVRQLAFVSPSYTKEVHDRIIHIAKGEFGGAKEICLMISRHAEVISCCDCCALVASP